MTTDESCNPCIKICRFSPEGICLGCHRSRSEVKGWKRLSREQRITINRRVRPLMMAAAVDTGGRKRAKQLKTLDRKIAKLTARLDKARLKRAALMGGG